MIQCVSLSSAPQHLGNQRGFLNVACSRQDSEKWFAHSSYKAMQWNQCNYSWSDFGFSCFRDSVVALHQRYESFKPDNVSILCVSPCTEPWCPITVVGRKWSKMLSRVKLCHLACLLHALQHQMVILLQCQSYIDFAGNTVGDTYTKLIKKALLIKVNLWDNTTND